MSPARRGRTRANAGGGGQHGHSFFVVKTHGATMGPDGAYNPFDAAQAAAVAAAADTAHPLRKDTVYVPAMGYAVLRFALDNAGLWLLHCHVLWHQAVGMGMALQFGPGASREVMERAGRGCSTVAAGGA